MDVDAKPFDAAAQVPGRRHRRYRSIRAGEQRRDRDADAPEGTRTPPGQPDSAVDVFRRPARTRKGGALAWVSPIPHWMYFVALPENQPLWYRIMVWTSAAVCLLAVL